MSLTAKWKCNCAEYTVTPYCLQLFSMRTGAMVDKKAAVAVLMLLSLVLTGAYAGTLRLGSCPPSSK